MTTGSSSSRTPEYDIPAAASPAAETTAVTGTHTVRTASARSDAEAATVRPSAARSPVPREPVPREPAPRARGGRPADARRPAPHEQAHGPVPGPDDEDLFTDEELLAEAPAVHGPAGHELPGHHDVARSYGDPVGDLVRAAVADRPLEEVVDLITMLERSPQYARATGDALRAVGVDRSVEDVTRLVGLLTRPPRHPDSADEAIRAAAEHRSVEDVTRLMALLHRTPLEPHCGREAVRAAATGRPVEELVELIGRLAEEQQAHAGRPEPRLAQPAPEDPYGIEAPTPPEGPAAPAGAGLRGRERHRERRRFPRPARRDRTRASGRAPRDRGAQGAPRDRGPAARRAARRAQWPTWLTVAALAGCGVAYFPLHQNDASVRGYAFALGTSALCLVVALLLTVRAAVPVLAVAVVLPAALAAAKLYGTVTPSAEVSRTVDLTLAPTWTAVGVAVLTSLVALTALCVRVASQAPTRARPARPVTAARRAAD
ncbi:hypothetical protein ACIRFH_18755 [Streptomyces sp. NPDC093586]|uniref:hypothetical protein n=1 Tax=Streptomyces sp. NPDC093586 TaxID=3366042 RepID=UPI0037FE43FE